MLGTKMLAGHLDAKIFKATKNQTLKTMSSGPVGMRGSAKTRLAAANASASRAVANSGSVSKARKIVYGGGVGGASLASFGLSRPKANESRTSYRGPMQTGRGIGRFS